MLVRYFQPTSITCLLEPWLRELGFSIFYGSILIKLYKILTEFQTRKAHRVCLRDKDQIVYLLAIVLIVVGYMSAWTALMVDGFFVGKSAPSVDARQPEPKDDPSIARLSRRDTARGPADETASRANKLLFTLAQQEQQEPKLSAATLSNLSQAQVQHPHHRPMFLSPPDPALHELRRRNLVSSANVAANEHIQLLARGLDEFGQLFSGLLETERRYDPASDLLLYFTRCRKLTWDYVTESSKLS